MRYLLLSLPLLASALSLVACGGDDSAASDAGTPDASIGDTGSHPDAPIDSGAPPDTGAQADTGSDTGSQADTGSGDAASDSGGDGGATVTLKVEDYLSWCTVAVNGGTPSTTATQTLTFPSGTVVNLAGDTAGTTFVWGYWVGTAGDTSVTHDQAKATTVTMSADKTVQACCPFATSPNTPCPPPN